MAESANVIQAIRHNDLAGVTQHLGDPDDPADPNATHEDGATLLQLCAQHAGQPNQLEIARVLIRAGADIRRTTINGTPLDAIADAFGRARARAAPGQSTLLHC